MEFRECLLSIGTEIFVFQSDIQNQDTQNYNLPAVFDWYENWSLTLRIRWLGNVAVIGDNGGAFRILVWKPEGNRRNGRHSWRREGNIKMDLQNVGSRSMDRIDLARYGTGGQAIVRVLMELLKGTNFLSS